MTTQASGDDGIPSQPGRNATDSLPDTGESGDTYNAEREADSVRAGDPGSTAPESLTKPFPQRGVIDHVSRSLNAVAYAHLRFERTEKIAFCYFCQDSSARRRTHWLVVRDSYKQRCCRRCMIRTKVYGAFLAWLKVGPW